MAVASLKYRNLVFVTFEAVSKYLSASITGCIVDKIATESQNALLITISMPLSLSLLSSLPDLIHYPDIDHHVLLAQLLGPELPCNRTPTTEPALQVADCAA